MSTGRVSEQYRRCISGIRHKALRKSPFWEKLATYGEDREVGGSVS